MPPSEAKQNRVRPSVTKCSQVKPDGIQWGQDPPLAVSRRGTRMGALAPCSKHTWVTYMGSMEGPACLYGGAGENHRIHTGRLSGDNEPRRVRWRVRCQCTHMTVLEEASASIWVLWRRTTHPYGFSGRKQRSPVGALQGASESMRGRVGFLRRTHMGAPASSSATMWVRRPTTAHPYGRAGPSSGPISSRCAGGNTRTQTSAQELASTHMGAQEVASAPTWAHWRRPTHAGCAGGNQSTTMGVLVSSSAPIWARRLPPARP